MSPLIIAIIVIVFLGFWVAFSYNSFMRLVNRGKEAWADIDVQLKRRYDLIPNLVQTVKGYALHESQAFEKVTQARSAAIGARSINEKGEAENMLSGALKNLFAVAEAYPDLKANQNFLNLQNELSDTENKIQAARRFYNGNVMSLNTKVDSFPSNIIAGFFKISKMDFFELENEEAREPVSVNL
jgi:LemA protein